MAQYAQIRNGRIRLIQESTTMPFPGEWVDLTDITPQPQVGWYYDGTTFYDLETVPLPLTPREKALKLAKTINKTALLSGTPSEIGKAVAVLLLMSDLFDE